MKIFVNFFLLLAITSCVSSPKVIQEKSAYDASLNCSQLDNEIRKTQQIKVAAREDDHFKLSHINPITGIWSVINMNRAESAAQQRLDHLGQLRTQKQCSDNPMPSPYGMMMAPPTYNPMNPSSFPAGMPPSPYPYTSTPMGQIQPQQPYPPLPSQNPIPRMPMPSPGPSLDSMEIDMGQ